MERLRALKSLHEKILKDKFAEKVTEEEIMALAELENKLESGLLVELPCGVGDTVWYVNSTPSIALKTNTVYEGKVVSFFVHNYPQPLGEVVCATIQIHNEYGVTEIPDIKDFGKSWFLSKAQAEARLKELQEGR